MAKTLLGFTRLVRTSLRKGGKLFALTALVFLFFQFIVSHSVEAQVVVIPREGFPYCQPFQGGGPFDYTILGGEIRIPVGAPENPTSNTIINSFIANPTGQSLQLTPYQYWHSGYAIVDIPFSSQFGIRASFEYFSYGPFDRATERAVPADGISFFMFDADRPIDIGYLGGSLAYAPYIDLDGTELQPGIAGGYVGIGFDERGNFGVGTLNQDNSLWLKGLPNTITIRGPETSNYDVLERFVTNRSRDTDGIEYLPSNPEPQWFDIDNISSIRTIDCNQPGYRKVFIELTPNGLGGYDIKIDMLVNDEDGLQLVSFPPINYPYAAPERLKIGFAGSTGYGRNNHEIRNVTVNVADISAALLPQVSDQEKIICKDDDLEFTFDVNLQSGNDAFITCMQLFANNPGPPDNSVPPNTFDCGFDGSLCTGKCNPDNYEVPVYDASGNLLGTFYSILEELNTGNFEDERNKATIRFEPAPGFTGEATVYYNVTDNYGLTSQPSKITVVSNPFPIKIQDGSIDNPTCDGQQDGRIYDVIVGDLVAGFDYEWLFDGNSIGKSGASVSSLVNGEATFELAGVNLGTYTLNVWNPSDSQTGGCYESVVVVVDQENGTPVTIDIPDKTICEGEDVSFLPLVDPADIPSGATPTFLWYQNANRSGGALVNNSTIDVDGNQVTVSIAATGELTLSGLKNNGANSTYEFFVEVADQTQAGGNFCPYIGDVLTKATVLVNPPLTFSVDHKDDWCISYSGEIVATITGASDVTYTLLDENDQELGTNSTGVFSSLPAGLYKVFGSSPSLGCSSPIEEVTVEGPAEGLVIAPGAVDNSYCGLPNGSITFDLFGGNVPYQSIKVNGTQIPYDPKGVYTVTGLSATQYTIDIIDAKGCTTSQTMEVAADPPSNFTTIGSEVCEGKVGTANLDVQDPSTGSPIFEWYYQNAVGDYVLISDGMTVGDYSYQISSDFELSVTGLPADPDPYIFYLLVSGDRICDQGYIPTEIKVTPGPEMNAPIVTETCFGESTGSIQAQIPGNNYADFEFSISGYNGVFVDFSNNGGLFENLPAGEYKLSIKSALDCITTLDGIEVLEPSEPIGIANQSIERASCDLPNGSVKDIQIVGGWGNYSVEWRKGAIDGSIVTGDITGASDLFPDTYYLLVMDEKGCSETFEFIVEELSDPVYDLVPPINVCEGEQVEIRPIHLAPDPNLPPAAFTEVFWYKDQGQNGLIENGTDPSNLDIIYTIDDTDWLNPRLLIDGLPEGTHDFYFYVECTGQEIEVEIEVYAIPTVQLETTPVSCFGAIDGKVNFISGTSPVYEYSINSAAPISQSEFEAMGFAAGTYTVEVTTPAGCPQELEFTIEGPDAALEITPLTGIDPGCGALNGKLEATISGGWSPYQITVIKDGVVLQTIMDSGSSVSLNGLGSGIYLLEVEDAQGCQISSTELELIDGPSQILVDDQAICEGQQVVLTPTIDPATPGATFEWYFDSNTNQEIVSSSTPNAQGITYEIDGSTGALSVSGLQVSNNPYQYYVIAVGAGVCTGFVAEAEVMVYGTPTASYTKVDEVCFEDGGSINVTASGGSGNYTFTLDGQISQDSGLFENVPRGIHTVTISTPETCEVQLANIEILGPSAPLEAEITDIVNPSCDIANGSLTLTVTGGVQNYSVEAFKDGTSQGTFTSDQNGIVLIPDVSKGEFVFEITDALGCTITLSEPLELVEVPTEITVEDQLICEGQDAVLIPTVPSSVDSPVFTWFFDEEMNNQIQNGSVNGVDYQINSNGELSVSGLAPSSQAYEYYAMVEGNGVCGVIPEKALITVTPYPNLRVSNPSIVCDPEGTVDLTNYIEGYNPSVYEYNIISPLGTALVGNEVSAVNVSGNYEVSSSMKGTGCWTASQRILVRIAEELLESNFLYHADQGGGIILSNDVIQVKENVDFEDISTGEVIIWEWNFGDGSTSNQQNPNHVYQKKGTYTVTLKTTDSIGCQSVYSITVDVKDDYLLMMPNAFTPDGLKNQYYKPLQRGIASIEFYVFNTWGELIYQTDSLEDLGWDGNHNGKPAPNGNYVYKVKYETRSGNVFDESGVFILIR